MASSPQTYQRHDGDGVQRARGNSRGRGERTRKRKGRRKQTDTNVAHDVERGLNNGRQSDALRSDNVRDTLDVEPATTSARSKEGDRGNQDEAKEISEVCFICASTIKHLSITPCNHQTCHVCALRLRALYEKRDCAYCKSEVPFVIFTDDSTKKYEDFDGTKFFKLDQSLGIKYETATIEKDTVFLLQFNCPDRDCDAVCLSWNHLRAHIKQKHGKSMCELCARNKKAFTTEHELFSVTELRRHQRHGDDRPGSVNQSGFRGHPECGFCSEKFYGDDELYDHCRQNHERCHICDRRNPGNQVQYYCNYGMLERHFEADHFVCLDTECQENKTNVFESEMDLKAHQLSSHPNGLSKDARRDARLVSIASFDYRAPYQPQRRDRDHRGNGRGRDPNAEALPISSAQPLRRDELAYQRQMAIVNAQPQVQAQLVTRNHAVSPVPRNSRPVVPPQAVPDLSSLLLDASSPLSEEHSLSPQEQARRVRHTHVLERASNLLQSDKIRLVTFCNQVSSYKTSTVSARELIDSFFPLFDVPSAEIGKLVRELADIYEDETKRQDLLEAWNDYLSINEDYPSLSGANGTLPGMGNGSSNGTNNDHNDIYPGGRRVLRLKSSTAQSSRSEVSGQSGWGNALPSNDNKVSSTLANSAARQSNPFPLLAPIPSSLSNGQPRTPWTSGTYSTSTSTSTSSNAKSSTIAGSRNSGINKHNSLARASNNRTTIANGSPNNEMFPALPTGKKPNTLMAGLTRGTARWDDNGAEHRNNNPWSGSGAGTATDSRSDEVNSDDDAVIGGGAGTGTAAGRKAGKRAKQVLYKFG